MGNFNNLIHMFNFGYIILWGGGSQQVIPSTPFPPFIIPFHNVKNIYLKMQFSLGGGQAFILFPIGFVF